MEREPMEGLAPRPDLGHDELTTTDDLRLARLQHDSALSGTSPQTEKNYCQRCAPLHTSILRNLNMFESPLLSMIATKSLKAGCVLCDQFRRVFQWAHRSRHGDNDGLDSVFVFYLLDRPSAIGAKIIGLEFKFYLPWPAIEVFPMQNTQLACPPIVHRIPCPDEPDYEFIRTQLNICNNSHSQQCVRVTTGKHALRIIDCKSRRLVTIKPGEPYICLSYVWGSSVTQGPDSLGDELPASIPKTIEDAMAVAITLGVPFLWVDRYCIDQENLQEKHNIIQNMNRIYEGAEITIIAAWGSDPHHGLPGVRGTPRQSPLTLDLADTTFVAVDSVSDEINSTTWANRGWTYQEMLLSRRRLVFTSTQMYFQCRTMHWMESLHPSFTASDYASTPRFRGFPCQGIGHTVGDLSDRLMEYYKRRLSFDTDIIRAFDGIISAFDQSEHFPFRVTQFYGIIVLYKHDDEHLARKSFVSSLCWCVDKYSREILCESFGPVSQKNLFPSWSWASTKEKSYLGRFVTLRQKSEMTGLGQCDEVKVRIAHKTDEEMDLCAFSKHKDSYEMFLPSIKLTTWVLPCPLRWAPNGVPCSLGSILCSELQLDLSCHTIHLAYLGTTSLGTSSDFLGTSSAFPNQVLVLVLMLEEIEPGIFRRIDKWECMFEPSPGEKSAHDILDKMIEIQINHTYRSWPLGEKEAVSQLKWEMRDMTLV